MPSPSTTAQPTAITGPTFTAEPELPLADVIGAFLPRQGSFEVQHDQPGKRHDWHLHSLAETLFVVSGDAELFWHAGGAVHRRRCGPGTRIELPAGTAHGSTAGPDGCVYLIAPEDGATAVTTFLSAEEVPTG